MAQFQHRANIQSSVFPLLSELMGDDVIIERGDHTYVPDYNPSSDAVPVDRGVAQVMYAHNVMPSTYGYQSVGYQNQFDPIDLNVEVHLDDIKLMVSDEGTRIYVGIDYEKSGTLYVLTSSGEWIHPTGAPNITASNTVSVATINGVSYLCCAELGVWKYLNVAQEFEQVILDGLDNENIRGILQSTGYLVTWSNTGVAWSASDDPLDFVPSDITGAGAGEIQEAKGKITFCQQTSYGFIVYTENNAVSVTWSGNTDYPFNFKSIPGAGGVAGGNMVTEETVSAQYAYTTNGLQQIYHTGAKTVLAYITDFVAGQVMEDFNELTETLEIYLLDTTMKKRLSLINDRYLVLSYGRLQNEPFTHAIVVDLAQTRTGKLKLNHTAVFELRNMSPEIIETPRESIAFLQPDGKILTADLGIRSQNSKGVLITGRYRLQRAAKTTLTKVRVENARDDVLLNCKVYPLLNTKQLKNPQATVLCPSVGTETNLRDYYCMYTADTLALLFTGNFNIITLIIDVNLGGEY